MTRTCKKSFASQRALLAGLSLSALVAPGIAFPDHDGVMPSFAGAALAQGASSGPLAGPGAGSTGGPSGSGSGGTSGGSADPRGAGAGGSTAGAGAGVGGVGSSAGAGSVNQNRFGGGADTTPSDGTATIITNTILQGLTGGGAGGEAYGFLDRCADYRGGKLLPQDRIAGRNLELVNAAQYYVAPALDPQTFPSATYLLASYQEEIDRGKTDPLVAGSYLGLVATIPVTEAVVGRVNAILCVTTRAETARQIAENAEVQRRATQK